MQEVDVASGRVLLEWRSDEHVPVEASMHMPPPADPSVPWDYFHINSVAVDPSDGNLLISGRNTWACYKVHRHTGKVIWTPQRESQRLRTGGLSGRVARRAVHRPRIAVRRRAGSGADIHPSWERRNRAPALGPDGRPLARSAPARA